LNQRQAFIIATGGTIAGVAHGTQLSDGYQAGVISIDQLLENVPDLKRIARIEPVRTIGLSVFVVNCKKKAVSSNVSVPCVITIA
ncbi:unnamed protein product, partial [Rotaria sp. Silwood1]